MQMQFTFPATDNDIEERIRNLHREREKKMGMTKFIGAVAKWIWLIYLTPGDTGCLCSRKDIQRVIRERFTDWQIEASRNGWQPTTEMAKETWWREEMPVQEALWK